MPGMPDLPMDVPNDVAQEDGVGDKAPVYATHRGKKPTSRDVGDLPPRREMLDGPLRREQ